MKAHNGTEGVSYLQPCYYKTWAAYFAKFLKQYARHGLQMWAVSLQNEPTDGSLVYYGVNSMGWSPATLRRFLVDHLGPTLRRDGALAGTRIIIGEDTRTYIHWPEEILESEAAQELSSGVAFHWYTDGSTDPSALDRLHDKYPDQAILYTEACYGLFMGTGEPAVRLGSWERAENYTSDIIQVTNHWAAAWYDWNMALNTDGGPSWSENYLDASIVVNATADEFYKQPMYYAIAHFSRYVPPGSRRVALQLDAGETDVESVAFLTPKADVVVVLHNRNDSERRVVLRDPELGDLPMTLAAHSLHTLVYPVDNYEAPSPTATDTTPTAQQQNQNETQDTVL